jgi:hypothetical protein
MSIAPEKIETKRCLCAGFGLWLPKRRLAIRSGGGHLVSHRCTPIVERPQEALRLRTIASLSIGDIAITKRCRTSSPGMSVDTNQNAAATMLRRPRHSPVISSGLDELQKICIDNRGFGRRHTVRKSLVGNKSSVLHQFGAQRSGIRIRNNLIVVPMHN